MISEGYKTNRLTNRSWNHYSVVILNNGKNISHFSADIM